MSRDEIVHRLSEDDDRVFENEIVCEPGVNAIRLGGDQVTREGRAVTCDRCRK